MQNLFLNLLAMSTKKEQHIHKADYTSLPTALRAGQAGQNDCKEKFAKILQDESMNSKTSPNQFYHSEFVKQTTDLEGLPSNPSVPSRVNYVKRNVSKVKGKLREPTTPLPPFFKGDEGAGRQVGDPECNEGEQVLLMPYLQLVSPAFAGRTRSQRFAFEQSEGPVLTGGFVTADNHERIEPKAEGPDSRDSATRNVGEQLWQAPRGEYRVAILTEATPRETGDMFARLTDAKGLRQASSPESRGIEAQTSPRLPLLHTSPQSVPLQFLRDASRPFEMLRDASRCFASSGQDRTGQDRTQGSPRLRLMGGMGEEHGIDTELSSNLSAREGDVDGDRAHRPYTVAPSGLPSNPSVPSRVNFVKGLRELIQLTRNHEQTPLETWTLFNSEGNTVKVSNGETNLSDVLPTDVITQIGDEIQVNLKMGRQELRVQLKPEHLGSITLKVSMVEGVLSVDISTENTAVKSIIESHLHDLRQNLIQRGIEVGRFNISAEPTPYPLQGRGESDNMSQFGSQGGMFSSYSSDSRRNARQSPSWEELRVGSQQSLDETLEQKNWFLKQTMVDIWM